MLDIKLIFFIPLLILTGCTSSADLEKRASAHDKSGRYYESIGQPNAARDEYQQAKNDRDNANDAPAILVELYELFNDK